MYVCVCICIYIYIYIYNIYIYIYIDGMYVYINMHVEHIKNTCKNYDKHVEYIYILYLYCMRCVYISTFIIICIYIFSMLNMHVYIYIHLSTCILCISMDICLN